LMLNGQTFHVFKKVQNFECTVKLGYNELDGTGQICSL
jgi:hypothetical protein